MTGPQRCPQCKSMNTEFVDQQMTTDTVEHVRICNDCPTEYTAEYVYEASIDIKHYE